jgi:hypothetical protein
MDMLLLKKIERIFSIKNNGDVTKLPVNYQDHGPMTMVFAHHREK